MNESNDLREFHAGLAMLGLLMRGKVPLSDVPELAYKVADGMNQASKPTAGIVSIKRKEEANEKEI